MAKNLTPQQIAEKQIRRATAAVNDYKNGVQGVKVSPTEIAAQRVDQWAAGVQRAHQDGSYVDGCRSCSKEKWIDRTVNKGAQNYVPGIKAAEQDIVDFQTQNAANQAQIAAGLASMPRGDLSQNLMRMMYNAEQKAQFRYKKRRS
jgi:hypothetical protein